MAGEITLSGKNYILEVDTVTPVTAARGAAYNPILCEVSSDFAIETDEQTTTNKCNNGWGSSTPGTSTFSFSGEFQAIDPATGDPDAVTLDVMVNLAATRQTFWLRRKIKEGLTGTEVYREGRVYIGSYTETAGAEDPYTFTADFVGVGEPITTPPTT